MSALFLPAIILVTGFVLPTDDTVIALERYDRHVPFFMGTVTLPENLELIPLEVSVGTMPGRRDGMDRHGRMNRDQAFDMFEQSLSSFIMAKYRDLPFSAAPVFPRRLFSQNQIFVNVK